MKSNKEMYFIMVGWQSLKTNTLFYVDYTNEKYKVLGEWNNDHRIEELPKFRYPVPDSNGWQRFSENSLFNKGDKNLTYQ